MAPAADELSADFTDWVTARQHRLLRTAYLMTGDLHRAEDLLQEALIKLALRWTKVRDGNPDAFVRTILYRDNVSWWRRRRDAPVAHVEDSAARHDADATERGMLVRQALTTLTAKQRAVIVLRFFDDLTERETAGILGVSIGTVKSQTSAALTRLRERAPELSDLITEEGR